MQGDARKKRRYSKCLVCNGDARITAVCLGKALVCFQQGSSSFDEVMWPIVVMARVRGTMYREEGQSHVRQSQAGQQRRGSACYELRRLARQRRAVRRCEAVGSSPNSSRQVPGVEALRPPWKLPTRRSLAISAFTLRLYAKKIQQMIVPNSAAIDQTCRFSSSGRSGN